MEDRISAAFGMEAVGLLTIANGVLLLIGFLTPVTSALAATGSVVLWIVTPTPILLDTRLAALLMVVMATALGFLGPGAFSLDSHLFGRREIIIPSRSSLPRD